MQSFCAFGNAVISAMRELWWAHSNLCFFFFFFFLPQERAGEADKHFNYPFWEKAINIVCPALLGYEREQDHGISRASDVAVFSRSCFSVLLRNEKFCSSKTRVKKNRAGAESCSGGRSVNFRVETNIRPTANSHSSSVIHTARSKVTLPLLPLIPKSPLRPSALLSLQCCSLVHFNDAHNLLALLISRFATLTRFLQPGLVSGDSTWLTWLTLQNAKVN